MSADTSTAGLLAAAFEVRPAANPASPERRAEILADPGFGRFHTDHMVRVQWTESQGWHGAVLEEYGPLEFDPMTNFIHYGQSIFEGLKAYRHADGHIRTFRPLANATRFQKSARRLAMAELPHELFVGSLEALVKADAAWVPDDPEKSLYLRPFQYGNEPVLGVKPSSSYEYVLIASPVGAYFKGGVKPVTVWLSDDYVRAVPGGTGEAKCAGNYAASLLAQAEATAHECDQVVWLDGVEHRWVEEMGGMNLYFVYGEGDAARLVTPPLTGSLLPGVTRNSLLTLATDLGIPAAEEPISVEMWREGNESGAISEVFACGTAAVITPVGHVRSRAFGGWTVGDGEPGPVAMKLRKSLVEIQTGQVPDRHAWMHTLV